MKKINKLLTTKPYVFLFYSKNKRITDETISITFTYCAVCRFWADNVWHSTDGKGEGSCSRRSEPERKRFRLYV
jgi:hypothetical protein